MPGGVVVIWWEQVPAADRLALLVADWGLTMGMHMAAMVGEALAGLGRVLHHDDLHTVAEWTGLPTTIVTRYLYRPSERSLP